MPEPQRIRIIIVDDQAIMRESIRRLVQQDQDMCVVAEAADGDQAMDAVRGTAADAVLLDISMPKRNGLEVLAALRKEFPKLPVLMLSIHHADTYERRARELGASGYVNKEDAADELVDAIRAALA